MKIPYERLVQWAAGPISILAGLAATAAEKHLHFLGSAGLSRSVVANAIVSVGTFAVGAGVTYAAHHKWLDNLSKWWNVLPQPGLLQATSGNVAPSTIYSTSGVHYGTPDRPEQPESAVTPDKPKPKRSHRAKPKVEPETPPQAGDEGS